MIEMENEITIDHIDGIEILEDIERIKYIIDLYRDNKLSNEFEDFWLTNLMNLIPPWRNEEDKRHIALYWQDQSIVGMIHAFSDLSFMTEDSCYIEAIYVLRKYRCQDIGKKLFSTVLEFAQKNHKKMIYLDVIVPNNHNLIDRKDLIHYIGKQGFEKCSEIDLYEKTSDKYGYVYIMD